MPSPAPPSASAMACVFVEWMVGKKRSLPAKRVPSSAPSSPATSNPDSNACVAMRLVNLRGDAHTQIDRGSGVRKSANRNVIHAGKRVLPDIVEHDPTRGLNRNLLALIADDAYGLLHLGRAHIVEQQ